MSLKVATFFCIFIIAAEARHARILRGSEAQPHEFPHMVTLDDNGEHICGGGILNEVWVVTAAHCLAYVMKNPNFQIKAGKHSLSTIEDTEQVIKVAKRFRHKGYPGGTVVAPDDIALLKLEKPLIFNDYVQPISLPKSDVQLTSPVVLSGWGKMEHGDLPDKLRRAEFDIVDFDTCKVVDESIWGPPTMVTNSMLCVGPSPNNAYACNLDSGSPLIKKENGKAFLAGVFSWLSPPCGAKNSPSVFTKVSHYVDWINNIMENN